MAAQDTPEVDWQWATSAVSSCASAASLAVFDAEYATFRRLEDTCNNIITNSKQLPGQHEQQKQQLLQLLCAVSATGLQLLVQHFKQPALIAWQQLPAYSTASIITAIRALLSVQECCGTTTVLAWHD
jgi:hypothetical protein